MNLLNPTYSALAINAMAMLGLTPSEGFQIHEANENFAPGRVLAYNASMFQGNNPHEFLSNYAVRYTDPLEGSIAALQQSIAPHVLSNNSAFVEYPVYTLGDAYLALDQAGDAIRAIGADFTTMRNVAKTMVTQRMPNRGLAVEVDEDEELLDDDWQQRKVAWLIGILNRTLLRQTIALLVASANNTAKTWDATAGKDPDQDVLNIIDGMVIPPSDMIYGPAAWTKRSLALRAQNLAGQATSSTLKPEELAGIFSVNSLQIPKHRYATGATTANRIVGAYVFLYSAMATNRDDYSNLKTFTAPTKNGMNRGVFVRKIGDKRWRIAVDAGKQLVALTSSVGLEMLTIS